MAHVMSITLNPAIDLAFYLDQLMLGAVNRPAESQLEAAGKGVNVARMLAILGHQVTASGFLGEDNDGPFRHVFKTYGIKDAFVRVPGQTRINTKLAESDGRVTDINGPGVCISEADIQTLLQTLQQHIQHQRPEAIVIAGSLPQGVSTEVFGQCLQTLKATGIPLWLDTSGPALTTAIAQQPAAIKPNEHELAEWAGMPLSHQRHRLEAAKRLHQSGIEHALLSAGAEGVLWVSSAGIWQSTPPQVEARNTVSAGDTFMAGMLHGLLNQHAPDDTLRFATALSAESVRHLGVGDPQASDFTTLLNLTQVESMDNAATESSLS